MTDRSAIVIGAGPAGCIAAILLVRGGWNVRLIEQHRFPREKVCGECLSALGLSVLDRIGLADGFRRLDPVRLTHARIHAPNGSSLELKLPDTMWGLSRLRMDQWLLDAARDTGVQIVQPARCERVNAICDTGLRPVRGSVDPSGDSRPPGTGQRPVSAKKAHATIRDLETNELRTLQASWLLLADGKGSFSPSRPAPTNDLGLKAHFANIAGPRDAIELFGVGGHYGGVAPIESGMWNVAFSVPKSRVNEHRGDLDALFAAIVSENATLRSRFAGANRISEWLASPLPRFAVARRWETGVIPLGNAAGAVEPVGGEGMGLAMRSSEIAARMLLSKDVDPARLRREFQRLWRTRRTGCRAAGLIISQPSLANALIPILKHLSLLPGIAMSLMGKHSAASGQTVKFPHLGTR